jgi:hypothetical protein
MHRHSKPFMTGLLRIANSLSTANYQQLEPLTLTSRDRTFLLSIPQIVSKSSHDASRCEKIDCDFSCKHKLRLPELCRIAKTAKTSAETPMFYTKDTLVEYHCLLVNLLEHFKLHLCSLAKDAHRGRNCLHYCDMIRLFGSVLHNMVSSKIMGHHMLNIELSLWQAMSSQKQEKADENDQKGAKAGSEGPAKSKGIDWRRLGRKTAVAKAGDGDAGQGEGTSAEMKGEDEFDESIASIRIQATEYESSGYKAPGKSDGLDSEAIGDLAGSTAVSRCLQWLRLMTMYFDSMDQLLPSGLTSPRLPMGTKVQVLAVKHQGRKRMDWETVCLNYLPDSQTFPNGDELVREFKKYLEGDPRLRSWFDSKHGTFLDHNFPGTCHCEALASVLILLQREGLIKLLPV